MFEKGLGYPFTTGRLRAAGEGCPRSATFNGLTNVTVCFLCPARPRAFDSLSNTTPLFLPPHFFMASVMSGIERIALRKVSFSIWVYTRLMASLSCPMISRATTSETPAFFNRLVAV